MITARATFKTKPIDELAAFASQIANIHQQIGQRVYAEIHPALIDELRFKPDAPTYPIEWTSEKQRRAFFASDGFGGGIPTERTDSIVNGWRVTAKGSGNRYSIVAVNAVPGAPYVVGGMNFRSRARALRPQQKMHQNTGWPLAQDTLTFWLRDAAREEYAKEVDTAIGQNLASFEFSIRSR